MKSKQKSLLGIIVFSVIVQICITSFSDEIYLSNGDKITGSVLKDENGTLTVASDVLGNLSVQKKHVNKVVTTDGKEKEKTKTREEGEVTWKREIAAGYSTSRGNTEKEDLSGNILLDRKRYKVNQMTAKANMHYATSNRKPNSEKWYGMAYYGHNFGETKKWYWFARFEIDHDRFEDVNFRTLPAIGFGYWFFDRLDFKLLGEIGAGWEHTDYRTKPGNDDEFVIVPRAYLEKDIYKNTKFSQEFIIYPSITDIGDYRFRSESALTVSLNDLLAIRLSFIDEYNSAPPEDTKRNDLRFVSSLVCSF